MKTNYPKIGIRPTIDGRQGGVRESLEEKTMNLAKAVKQLIESNLKNGDGLLAVVRPEDCESALLISRRILDAKWYFANNESVTWETSRVRAWLFAFTKSLDQSSTFRRKK